MLATTSEIVVYFLQIKVKYVLMSEIHLYYIQVREYLIILFSFTCIKYKVNVKYAFFFKLNCGFFSKFCAFYSALFMQYNLLYTDQNV